MVMRGEGVSFALNVEPYKAVAKTSQRVEEKPYKRKKIDMRRSGRISLFTW